MASKDSIEFGSHSPILVPCFQGENPGVKMEKAESAGPKLELGTIRSCLRGTGLQHVKNEPEDGVSSQQWEAQWQEFLRTVQSPPSGWPNPEPAPWDNAKTSPDPTEGAEPAKLFQEVVVSLPVEEGPLLEISERVPPGEVKQESEAGAGSECQGETKRQPHVVLWKCVKQHALEGNDGMTVKGKFMDFGSKDSFGNKH
uniref:Uncharacterized protein n=1 Tax=Sphaerodactylus townsendi TaxID=933632 RepID=A0ACB8EFR5_9SAUR